MTILIIGASGATGKLLVEQLADTGHAVKIIVRPQSPIPNLWSNWPNITIIRAHITEIDAETMALYVSDCDAVVSCLGHNLTWNGIFGKPRDLVTRSVALVSTSIIANAPRRAIKFVLMNTAGNRNRDIEEIVSFGENLVVGLIKLLIPPHADNENAADYLRVKVGRNNPYIGWVVVRPDSLVNEESVSPYSLHASPTRSAIFNPGKTSRVNVANLMSTLIVDEGLWQKWKGKMPVIYNDKT